MQTDRSKASVPIVRLISFGAGPKGMSRALERLTKQARAFPWIDETRTYSKRDLTEEYFSKVGNILQKNPKGFGLWSWKPFLIERELNSMKSGDVLIYLDAGVEINKRGASRFTHYLDYLARENMLFFSLDHQHRQWTKQNKEIFDTGDFYFRNQVVAGVLMFRVSESSKKLVARWKELCSFDGGALLEDPAPSSEESHEQLIEHRHDQSLLSRAVFEAGIDTWQDETIFKPWGKGRDFPFLAIRNKSSSLSWLPWALNTPFFVWRVVYVLTNPILLRATIRKKLQQIFT